MSAPVSDEARERLARAAASFARAVFDAALVIVAHWVDALAVRNGAANVEPVNTHQPPPASMDRAAVEQLARKKGVL